MVDFTAGGWGMYPTCGFGVVLLLLAIRFVGRPERRQLPLLAAIAGVMSASAVTGFTTGVIRSTMAEDARTLWLGVGEAMNVLSLAAMLATFAGVFLSVGVWRLTARVQ